MHLHLKKLSKHNFNTRSSKGEKKIFIGKESPLQDFRKFVIRKFYLLIIDELIDMAIANYLDLVEVEENKALVQYSADMCAKEHIVTMCKVMNTSYLNTGILVRCSTALISNVGTFCII